MDQIAQPLGPAAPPLAAHVFETDRRRATREDVALETVMADRWGRSFTGRILNMSETGLLAEADVDLCERDPVRIDVPTVGWMRGQVAWALSNRIGVRFRDRITPDAFASFVSVFGAHPRG
jgi:PilZ domain